MIIWIIFSIQNYIFYFYPNTIFDFLSKGTGKDGKNTIYLYEFIRLPKEINFLYYLFMNLVTIFISIWISNKKITLQNKYSYASLMFLIFGIYGTQQSIFNLIPFLLLLIIPYLKEFNFSMHDIPVYIFLFSIFLFNILFSHPDTFFKYLPFLKNPPYVYIIYLRWVFVIVLLLISLVWIIKENKKIYKKDDRIRKDRIIKIKE